jgi:hypothetical protein
MKCAVLLDILGIIFRINKEKNDEFWKSNGIMYPQFLPVRSDQIEYPKVNSAESSTPVAGESLNSSATYHMDFMNPFLGTKYGYASTCFWDVHMAHVIPSFKLYSATQLKEFMKAVTEKEETNEDSKDQKEGLIGSDMKTLLNSQWCSVSKVVGELKTAVQWLTDVNFLVYAVQIRQILIAFYRVCE